LPGSGSTYWPHNRRSLPATDQKVAGRWAGFRRFAHYLMSTTHNLQVPENLQIQASDCSKERSLVWDLALDRLGAWSLGLFSTALQANAFQKIIHSFPSLIDRNKCPRFRPDVLRRRPNQPIVSTLLDDVCRPTGSARDDKYRRAH